MLCGKAKYTDGDVGWQNEIKEHQSWLRSANSDQGAPLPAEDGLYYLRNDDSGGVIECVRPVRSTNQARGTSMRIEAHLSPGAVL